MPAHDLSGPTISEWLGQLGLGTYTQQFQAENIDLMVLPHLTDADLKEIGVTSLGHRRLILAAVQSETQPPKGEPETGERRFITVLFCDLVGSTALAKAIGEEAFSEILGRFYSTVEQTVSQFGGTIAQYLGDGIMVYFGSPTPLEDAANCAIQAALKLPDRVRKVGGNDLSDMEIRMGIASGFTVLNQENTGSSRAYGATVHLAARLQAEAKPGQVILAETTASLVRGNFELIALDKRPIKGFDDPGDIFLAQTSPQPPDNGENHSSNPSAFINRTKEMRVLEQAFEGIAGSSSSVVTISGEPGIGKSRLVQEFLSRPAPNRSHLFRFPFHFRSNNVPFSAFRTVLNAPPDAQNARAPDWHLWQDQGDGTSLGQSRERRRHIIASLLTVLSDGSDKQPTIIWFDDIQWADPSSLEVMQTLLDQNHTGQMVIISSRQQTPSWTLDLPATANQIHMAPLTAKHTRDLIQSRLDMSHPAPPLVDKLVQRANGVPIFAEELANDLQGQAGDLISIPSSLHQSVQARIGRLGSGRSLLRLMACVDGPCLMTTLNKLWQAPTPLADAVDEITEAGFLRGLSKAVSGQARVLEIRHQLVLDCAYDMILSRDRPAIHRKIADVLAKSETEQVNPGILADQLERGKQFQEAAEQWAKAGRIAAAQSADAEAVALFQRALNLLGNISDLAWANEFEADTILSLYPVIIGASGYRSVDPKLTARLDKLIAETHNGRRLFSAMFFRWLDMVTQGDIDIAHDFSLGLGDLAAKDHSEIHPMVLDRMLASTCVFRGEFDEARVYIDHMLSTYEPDTHRDDMAPFGATDNFVTVLTCLTAVESASGQKNKAQAAMNRTLTAAKASGHIHSMCHTLTFAFALPAILLENWADLEHATKQLSTLVVKEDRPLWAYFADMLHGFVLVQHGQIEKGQATFEAATDALVQQGFHFMIPTFRTLFLAKLTQKTHTTAGPRAIAQLRADLMKGERWMLPVLDQISRSPSRDK